MSISTIVKDVATLGDSCFDHSGVIREEIDKFVDRFEKNERYREFDGILRASHALVESSETPIEKLFDIGKMTKLMDEVGNLTRTITSLVNPTYKNEHELYLETIKNDQRTYVKVCREQAVCKIRSMTANR